MNANEVIATLAARALGHSGARERSRQHGPEQQRRGADGHPRRAALMLREDLLPALDHLESQVLRAKEQNCAMW
jgi:fumarate hydratase class II